MENSSLVDTIQNKYFRGFPINLKECRYNTESLAIELRSILYTYILLRELSLISTFGFNNIGSELAELKTRFLEIQRVNRILYLAHIKANKAAFSLDARDIFNTSFDMMTQEISYPNYSNHSNIYSTHCSTYPSTQPSTSLHSPSGRRWSFPENGQLLKSLEERPIKIMKREEPKKLPISLKKSLTPLKVKKCKRIEIKNINIFECINFPGYFDFNENRIVLLVSDGIKKYFVGEIDKDASVITPDKIYFPSKEIAEYLKRYSIEISFDYYLKLVRSIITEEELILLSSGENNLLIDHRCSRFYYLSNPRIDDASLHKLLIDHNFDCYLLTEINRVYSDGNEYRVFLGPQNIYLNPSWESPVFLRVNSKEYSDFYLIGDGKKIRDRLIVLETTVQTQISLPYNQTMFKIVEVITNPDVNELELSGEIFDISREGNILSSNLTKAYNSIRA